MNPPPYESLVGIALDISEHALHRSGGQAHLWARPGVECIEVFQILGFHDPGTTPSLERVGRVRFTSQTAYWDGDQAWAWVHDLW